MKNLFLLLILFWVSPAFGQEQDIYKLTFEDTSNFTIMDTLNHKQPDEIYILGKTKPWNPKRFWLADADLKSPQRKKELAKLEHHPYNHTYLFRDSVFDKLIDDQEKQALSERSAQLKSKKLNLNGPGYKTIKTAENITGFYVATSQPVFTSDYQYAFIDMVVFHKKSVREKGRYYGTIFVVYQKQPDNSWKKIKRVNHLLL